MNIILLSSFCSIFAFLCCLSFYLNNDCCSFFSLFFVIFCSIFTALYLHITLDKKFLFIQAIDRKSKLKRKKERFLFVNLNTKWRDRKTTRKNLHKIVGSFIIKYLHTNTSQENNFYYYFQFNAVGCFFRILLSFWSF